MSEANNPGSEEPQELAPEAEAQGADTNLDAGTVDNDDNPEGEETEGLEPEDEEIEYDGEKYRVPPKLKEALTSGVLRQDDYTKKTQTLAEQRREVEARQQALEADRVQQAEVVKALREDVVKVGTLEGQFATFKDVDWRAAQSQILNISDPQEQLRAQAQYNIAWNQFTAIERDLGQAKTALTQKEQEFATAQTQRVQAAVRETLQSLQQDDATFNIDKAQAAIKHAMDNFGLTQAEAQGLADKRIWKLLLSDKSNADRIKTLEAENAKLKGQRTAQAANTAAQQVRPAVRVGGSASASTTPRDDMPIDQWVRAEEARMAKKAARS